MKTPYEAFAIECMSGWKGLYQPLLDLCKLYGVEVLQVKEKFGGLRFYVGGGRAEELDAIIAAAEARSLSTCEDCGEHRIDWVKVEGGGYVPQPRATTGPSETSGWIRTLCAPCRTKWDDSRRK